MKQSNQGIMRKPRRVQMRSSSLFLLLMLFIGSSQLQASCLQPEAPAIPESEVMSVEEMAEVKKTVETYMEQANKFIKCTKRKKRRNIVIDEMRAVAADYNVLIIFYREYQAKQEQ